METKRTHAESSAPAKKVEVVNAKADDFTLSKRDCLVLDHRKVSLLTPIQPHQADHSFNGVVAVVVCKGPEAIRIHGFGVSGTLGPVSVFVHKKPNTQLAVTPSPDVWDLVYNKHVTPPQSVRELAYVRLDEPIVIEPNTERGFYIHVAVFHDDGLRYQTFPPGLTIIEDHRMQLKVGAGRCGERPFLGGWWRGGRGLAGSVLYEAMRKIWSPKTHKEFPQSFRDVIVALLILWYREETVFHRIPLECMFSIFEQLEHDWFENLQPTVAALNTAVDDEDISDEDSGEYYDGRFRYWQL